MAKVFKNHTTLIHMNLSNYFVRTDSVELISITCSLLALYFMHEIRQTSDVGFMPEISLHKCMTPRTSVNEIATQL